MRLAINENTGQDELENQIVANISYDQNSMSRFQKNIQ